MQNNKLDSSPDGQPDGSNRPPAPCRNTTWPIYVAAGQCDYGSDGNAWIAFDRVGDFVFDEEHLYVGSEPRPRGKGEDSAAPGEF